MCLKTVYYNGRVYTGKLPLCSAFIVEDGVFTFAGSDSDTLCQDFDKKIDLQGKFVCAGFNDSHMHLLNYGQSLAMAPLHLNTTSLENMIDCLRNTLPGRGSWILGRGWNQDYFQDVCRMPDRYDLDKVSREYPVCAIRACGHALCVNSRALEILGITANTPQVDGGEIGTSNGTPNGLFFDNAMDLVLLKIPAPNREEIKQMIRCSCQKLNSYGITSCHSDDYCVFHNVPWQEVNKAFQELETAGELTVRVYEQANITTLDALKEFAETGHRTGKGSDFFQIGPLKMLGDGALGARTAFLSRPYSDAPQTYGLSVFTQEIFDSLIGYANQQGMQTAIHCIGDACLDMVLHSIEKALNECSRTNHRHGIVHCQITRPDQLKKMAELGLHIYAQSIFLDYDIHMVEDRVGQDLASSSYSWKTLQRNGCSVSNGSDCPVELPDVMAGIQCAVTRRDLNGWGPYLPEQAFTLQEALDSFTKAGAYASFEENLKGQIIPGMAADFVILDSDPFEADSKKLKDIPILQTVLAGKTVFCYD